MLNLKKPVETFENAVKDAGSTVSAVAIIAGVALVVASIALIIAMVK